MVGVRLGNRTYRPRGVAKLKPMAEYAFGILH